jgi:hypothetical protein
MRFQELDKQVGFLFAGLAERPTDRLVNKFMLIS